MYLRASMWHDPVVTVVNGFGRRAGFRMQLEAYGSIPDSNKRPDSFAVSPDGTMELAIDVRTCLVTSPTNCLKASRLPGYAADQGAIMKLRDWIQPTQAAGQSFIPVCVEEGGRLGDGTHRVIDLFSLPLNSTTTDKGAFKTYALQRLHLTNLRGVARVINALKPIPANPHVVVFPTSYELAPPPPRPQAHARAPVLPISRPQWAMAIEVISRVAANQSSRRDPGVP